MRIARHLSRSAQMAPNDGKREPLARGSLDFFSCGAVGAVQSLVAIRDKLLTRLSLGKAFISKSGNLINDEKSAVGII